MSHDWITVLRRVNLNHLTVLIAIVECRSFRAAAARLHISQSALSVQVRQLEAAVGVQLLQRDTRSVSLTTEGRRLKEVFERSGVELARVITQLKDEGRLRSGVVVAAVLPSLASTYMPVLLPAFREQFPGIVVRMRDIDSRRGYEQVSQGAVDIGVLSRSPRSLEVPFQTMLREELIAVVPAAHTASADKDGISIRELACHPLLLNPPGVDMRDQLQALLDAEDIAVQPAQELTGTSALVALVSSGIGVTILPKSSLHGLDLRRCRLLKLTPPAFREIGVAMPPGRTLSPAAAAFKDFVLMRSTAVRLPSLTDASNKIDQ